MLSFIRVSKFTTDVSFHFLPFLIHIYILNNLYIDLLIIFNLNMKIY